MSNKRRWLTFDEPRQARWADAPTLPPFLVTARTATGSHVRISTGGSMLGSLVEESSKVLFEDGADVMGSYRNRSRA